MIFFFFFYQRDCLTGCENYKHVINVEAAKAPGPELVVSTEHTVGAGNATGMEGSLVANKFFFIFLLTLAEAC